MAFDSAISDNPRIKTVPSTILLMEESQEVPDSTGACLDQAGFQVILCPDGPEFFVLLSRNDPDLVLLGQSPSDPTTEEICLYLRQNETTRHVPVIMLTQKVTSADRIRAFESGVDDYLTLPLQPRELELRLYAILKRIHRGPATPSILKISDMTIDSERHLVEIDNRSIKLTPIEFRLLYYLASHAGCVVTRDLLLKEVWRYPYAGYTRTVDTHIKRLRNRLGQHRNKIETLRGIGYRFRIFPL